MASSSPEEKDAATASVGDEQPKSRARTVGFLLGTAKRKSRNGASSLSSDGTEEKDGKARPKSTFGILEDKETDEVPGTILLLSKTQNEPLGLNRMESHREDIDGLSTISHRSTRSASLPPTKRTSDGKIVLEPQPEESPNDPLNWPSWRRDLSLLSLGYFSMLGGGMTPILAAGFNDVARTYHVSYSDVALTTGLYMLGLGVGSVIFSPTAILWGKRPVYLLGSILFVLSAVWCALAPSYAQLVVARVFQGIAVSPVECLPSSTIAEIFFLHERAFRVGIYTLLLLGGKNLIPLVSAAIIESLGWRWVFWIVAICIGFGGILLFFFVPETFWDRTPRPRKSTRSRSRNRSTASIISRQGSAPRLSRRLTDRSQSRSRSRRRPDDLEILPVGNPIQPTQNHSSSPAREPRVANVHFPNESSLPHPQHVNSPFFTELENGNDSSTHPGSQEKNRTGETLDDGEKLERVLLTSPGSVPMTAIDTAAPPSPAAPVKTPNLKLTHYTTELREGPPQSWAATLRPFNKRMSPAKWWRVACRPFVLYAYPSVLWSALVYSLSVGWLIVLSESVAHIFENKEEYNFSALQTGLVYLSPFIGGVLGTAVAGKVSDIIVRALSKRNGGVYEPEFRLVMAIPITITTAIGLMGFGWSAQERDNFMVPTVFFGIISFGCCIGSTTSITFTLDSYRQFAGEALVTLNFSKNILHGLVWSLFFPAWLQADGSRTVFLAIGGIQIGCMLTTIPMYIYGKRARMWTVRKRLMEKF